MNAVCWNCGRPSGSAPVCDGCGAVQQAAPPIPQVPPAAPGALVAPLPAGAAPAPSGRRAQRGIPDGDRGPALHGRAAGTGARLAAFTIDAVVVVAVAAAGLVLTRSAVMTGVLGAEAVAALCLWEARAGLTVGNGVLRLRTTRADRPWSPGVGRQAARAVVLAVGGLVALVGAWVVVASSAWDPTGRRRTWADRAGGTVVVAVPRRVRAAAPTVPVVAPGLHPAALAPRAEPLELRQGGATFGPPPVAPAPDPLGAPPGPAPSPPTHPGTVPGPEVTLLLVVDTGQRALVPLGTAAVLGRAPAAVEPHDQLVPIRDPEGTVSKNHLRLEHDRDGVWVTDLRSSNGTLLLDDDARVRLEPGTRSCLDDGVRVRLGNRAFTATIVVGEG